ncbi:hypothetical protein EBH_0007590 [Eimeria brunetti]|uniref:Uncharacterized protein n=1 Tax=Eimeria brunetti TaxID=51314 RepID=U6LW44_9EIME|nr:hypothetical protein EBH_0007590 [Eimeria brunetti]
MFEAILHCAGGWMLQFWNGGKCLVAVSPDGANKSLELERGWPFGIGCSGSVAGEENLRFSLAVADESSWLEQQLDLKHLTAGSLEQHVTVLLLPSRPACCEHGLLGAMQLIDAVHVCSCGVVSWEDGSD